MFAVEGEGVELGSFGKERGFHVPFGLVVRVKRTIAEVINVQQGSVLKAFIRIVGDNRKRAKVEALLFDLLCVAIEAITDEGQQDDNFFHNVSFKCEGDRNKPIGLDESSDAKRHSGSICSQTGISGYSGSNLVQKWGQGGQLSESARPIPTEGYRTRCCHK